MTNREEQFRQRLLATFQSEAEEYVKGILLGLADLEVALESPPLEEAELIEPIYRQFHSLKGAAQALSFDEVSKLCQGAESILATWKKDLSSATKSQNTKIVDSTLRIAKILGIDPQRLFSLSSAELPAVPSPAASSPSHPEPLAAPAPEQETALLPAPAPTPIQSLPVETIRIRADKLDLLLRRGEQLVLARLNSYQRWQESQSLVNSTLRLRKGIQEHLGRGTPDPFWQEIEEEVRTLLGGLQRHHRHQGADYHEFNNQLQALLSEVKGARLAPVRPLLEELELAARRIARQLQKKIKLEISGRDLELDRSILELLKDPLLHLVRNALDHGLESAEERQEQKKDIEGTLTINVASKGIGLMEFSVSDDGRGIQSQEVLEAARNQGLIVDGVQLNSLDLIFTSGLSTSAKVTELSGRGLGMAIVREKVEQLKGSIRVQTTLGRGTTFTLTIPTSLATFEGLSLREGGHIFVFPLSGVQAVCKSKRQDLVSVEGNQALRFRGQLYPVARLGQMLKLNAPPSPLQEWPTIIIGAGNRHLALLVDEILGVQEVLSRDLGPQLQKVRFVMGACMLGYRQVAPILNVPDLLTHARSLPNSEELERGPAIPSILVADDSISTRTLVRGLLQAAHYRVQVAADGLQAWEMLQNERFDLLISDLEMPGLNGFELTVKVRTSLQLKKMPIILITAHPRESDHQRGLKLGANAYVPKSLFARGELQEAVGRLIGPVEG